MLKKISAMLVALTLSVCVFTSCGKSSSSDAESSSSSSSASESDSSSDSSDSSSDASSSQGDSSDASSNNDSSGVSEVTAKDPSLTIDGKKIDIDNFTMCTIDGVDIDFMTFRYFYFETINQFTQEYGANLDTIKNISGGFENLIKATVENIKNSRIIIDKLFKENNLSLSEDDKKKIEEDFESTKKSFSSEEEYKVQLLNAHLTEDIFKTNLEYLKKKDIISSTLFTNDGKYATKRADFKNIVKDTSKYASETHILIPFYAEVELDEETKKTYDSMTLENKISAKREAYNKLDDASKEKAKQAAKAKADEALKKALAGEDFNELIKQYGWDTALAANNVGYYFSKDNTTFPTELVQKAFSLKENEIDKEVLVHETYGYFVVKRQAVDMTYVEKYLDSLIQEYDTPLVNKLISEMNNNLEVKYCDGWDKLDADSIN